MFVVPSSLPNCYLTPSWNFPCYTLLLSLLPLPTAAASELHPEAEETEDEGLDDLEDQFASKLDEEEEEEESFMYPKNLQDSAGRMYVVCRLSTRAGKCMILRTCLLACVPPLFR